MDSMGDFRWENRLLVGYGLEAGQIERLQREAEPRKEELADRKLVLLLAGPEGLAVFGEELEASEAASLEAEIRERLGADRAGEIALVGLDGGVKSGWSAPAFSFAEAFSQIDAMPMRRAELRERNPDGP